MVLSREITARIRDVLEKHPEGLSITDLVGSVDVNRNTAGRYLENLLLSGQVEMRRFGMAKMYTLAKRLPVSSVLSLSSELVIQLDFGQRVFYANDPLLSFIGVSATDLFGKNIEFTAFSIVFEDVFPELIDRIRQGLKGEEWRGELTRPVRGKFFLCRIAPTVTSEGKKGVSVLLEDISDRKRDEERIRQSESRYRILAETSRDLIFVIGRDDRVEYVNSYAAAMLGISADQIVGKRRSALFSGELGQHQAQGLRQVFDTGKAGRGEGAMEIAGSIRWFDHYLMPILDAQGDVNAVLGVSRDITERREAERALQESEDRYRKLVEISPDAVILHRERKVIYANPAAVRLVGAGDAEKLLGREILDLVQPEYRDAVRANIAKDLSGETTPPMVLQLRRGDGSSAIVEGRGVSTFIDGRPAVLVALNDITERYRAGLALKESEERYRSMFENTGAATVIVEENTIISLMNSEFERFSGYTRAEIEKKRSWTEFVVKEDLERMLAIHYQRREGGDTPRQYEFGFIRKNGEIRRVLNTVSLIPGTTRTVSSLIDITDRRMADETLVQREQRYRFIADNSLDIINRQTPDCTLTYVSPAVTPLLGYSETEVLGKSMLAMVHPDDLATVRREIMDLLQSGRNHVTSTFRFRHRDGHYLWFESMTKVIRDEKNGQIREFLSISRDITARKSSGAETRGD
jgi:PAS domain S-box-containing protein